MIDLHCHILPGIDDGASDVAVSLEMARVALDDGIRYIACTPHIYPGMYNNTGEGIRSAVAALALQLSERQLPLDLGFGADAHLAPDLLQRVRSGRVPTLNDTRYLLLEPPHHVAPPRFLDSCFELLAAGYVPVITHPERLTWIDDTYESFTQLAERGAWMQVTASSVTGAFGSTAKYWAERMLDEGFVHLLATDSHGVTRRPPILSAGRRAAEKWVGKLEASRLVLERPQAILDNLAPESVVPPPALAAEAPGAANGERLLDRLAAVCGLRRKRA